MIFKRFCLSVCLLSLSVSADAQMVLDSLFSAVEHHHPSLKALRATLEAERLENRIATRLPDPEIELEILRGKPSELGTRTGFKAVQGFDFATLSGRRRGVVRSRDAVLRAQYRAERSRLFLEARLLVVDIIHSNAALRLIESRRQTANELLMLNEKRLRSGDVTRLDHNNARLSAATLDAEALRLQTEREALHQRLNTLCGGAAPTVSDTLFTLTPLPDDFDRWLANVAERSPLLAEVKAAGELSRAQRTLSRAENLPTLKVGYMSECVPGETFRGLTLGVSLPLWSNRTRRRQAEAAVRAADERTAAAKVLFENELRRLHRMAIGRLRVAEDLRRLCRETDNRPLLRKAFKEGEISLLDYLLELSLFFDAEDKALNAEREYQQTLAELTAAEW